MTNLRYKAYRRVLAVLDELEEPELEHDEREVLSDAAEGCGPDRVAAFV